MDKEVIDWEAYLADPSILPLKDAHRLSNSWLTCPVGQLQNIERGNGVVMASCPKDRLLRELGLAFNQAIHEGDIHKARQFYEAIQERAKKLSTS